jgi:hypothetical protein
MKRKRVGPGLPCLIETAARVCRGDVTEQTVRSRVMLLRKNGLWSSAGKGVSADPAPSDASNLLLSLLGGGLVTKTAETVRMLRSSLQIPSTLEDGTFAPLPPISLFATLNVHHTLGQVLDALFSKHLREGLFSTELNVPITSVELSIGRHAFGWDAELWLGDGNTHYGVEYEYSRIKHRQYRDQDQLDKAVRRAREQRGDLRTTALVTHNTLYALAECVPPKTSKAPGGGC